MILVKYERISYRATQSHPLSQTDSIKSGHQTSLREYGVETSFDFRWQYITEQEPEYIQSNTFLQIQLRLLSLLEKHENKEAYISKSKT